MAFKPWFPLAVIAAVGSGFALWYSMDDYERSRYFGLLLGVPVSTYALLGLLGISGELK